MLDWLNTKAALSLCTVMLIAAAGMWFEHNNDQLQHKQFEALLYKFVDIVDTVCESSSYISVNITASEHPTTRGGIYLEPLFNGREYQIIITETHTFFRSGHLSCSKEYIEQVIVLEQVQEIPAGARLPRSGIQPISMLKLTSGTDIHIVKVVLDEEGIFSPAVVIAPYSR